MVKIISRFPAETKALGMALAGQIKQPCVLALTGPLGSGKTVFVKGLARGFGLKRPIKSPTFAILYPYTLNRPGLKRFFHLDLYRLKSRRELRELGFQELIRQPRSVIAIEWPKAVRRLLPKNTIHLQFSHGSTPKERIIYVA